jgi:hypothetical protein
MYTATESRLAFTPVLEQEEKIRANATKAVARAREILIVFMFGEFKFSIVGYWFILHDYFDMDGEP